MSEQFEIDRSLWRTGGSQLRGELRKIERFDNNNTTGHGATQLLNNEGYMCCLGFYALSCGHTKDQILSQNEPDDMGGVFYPTWLVAHNGSSVYNTQAAGELMHANDDGELSREAREQAVKDKFAENGVEVTFTGEYE